MIHPIVAQVALSTPIRTMALRNMILARMMMMPDMRLIQTVTLGMATILMKKNVRLESTRSIVRIVVDQSTLGR